MLCHGLFVKLNTEVGYLLDNKTFALQRQLINVNILLEVDGKARDNDIFFFFFCFKTLS